MEQDIKSLLEENLALTRENNAMLKRIRSAQRMAMIYRVIYWIVILGMTFGAYYFIQPYINSLLGYYGNIAGGVESINKSNSVSDIRYAKELLQQLGQ